LERKMAQLLMDPQLCRVMGEAGRVKAVREFGLERLVSQTLDAYRAVGWKD
jgi:glycosyltransferase involved in cell wall biosynthesis